MLEEGECGEGFEADELPARAVHPPGAVHARLGDDAAREDLRPRLLPLHAQHERLHQGIRRDSEQTI